jgi:hypothetical protein
MRENSLAASAARILLCAGMAVLALSACGKKSDAPSPAQTPPAAVADAPGDAPASPEDASAHAAATLTAGGRDPNAALPSCTPASDKCILLRPDCPTDIAGCVTAQIEFDFPESFFKGASVRGGLALAERHPRWLGLKEDTPGAETIWRDWSAKGARDGHFWTSVTVSMDLRAPGEKPSTHPAAFLTDVAFHPLAPPFGWSRAAIVGWTKLTQPIVLTQKGPMVLLSGDIRIAAPNAYLVIDKAKAKVIARLAAPRALRDGRFAIIDKSHMFYWSREGSTPRCVKAFGPALGTIDAGPAECGGVAATPDDGDYGLAQADAKDVAIVKKAAPQETAQADALGCGADAAGRVYRVAEDPSILIYAAQIICD